MRMRNLIVLTTLLIVGCQASKKFTQTFEREDDASLTLTLTSDTAFVPPKSGFLVNVFFKVFGGSERTGTYEQKTATGTVKGKFTAGKEGEKRWIEFKPEGADDASAWKLQVKLGGMLSDGTKTWLLKNTTADAKADLGLQNAGN